MNEQTTQLLSQLAEKLGTTSEYLWNILLRQAPISATTDLIMMVLAIVATIAMYKIHKRLSRPMNNETAQTYYNEYEGWVGVPMFFFGLVLFIVLLVYIFTIDNIVIGFINPEYWALQRILETIKPNCP